MLSRPLGMMVLTGLLTFFAGWAISAYVNGTPCTRGISFDRCYYDTKAGVLTCLPEHLTDEIPE